MQSFSEYLVENNMPTYWKGFEKIIAKRGYKIDPNGTDSFGMPVDKNTRVVVDKKTGEKRFRITRMIKGSTFIMDQLVARDDKGNTIKGLKILDLVYPYEKEFALNSSKIKDIMVDPVSKIVNAKIDQYYGEFDKTKKGKNIIIAVK